MMSKVNSAKLTTQGVGSPVSAADGSERTSSGSPLSNDCNDMGVAHLAPTADNVPSDKNPFRRSSLLRRSPPRDSHGSPRGERGYVEPRQQQRQLTEYVIRTPKEAEGRNGDNMVTLRTSLKQEYIYKMRRNEENEL